MNFLNTWKNAKYLNLLLCLLSGVLIGVGHLPHASWFMFVAYIPMWYVFLTEKSVFKIMFYGFVTEFLVNAIAMYWLGFAISEFTQSKLFSSYLAAFVIYIFTSNAYLISGLLWKLLNHYFNKNSIDIFAFVLLPFCFAIGKYLGLSMFPKEIGVSWIHMDWQGYQFLDIFGVLGLSLLTYLINLFVLLIFLKSSSIPRKVLGVSFVILMVFSFNYAGALYGKKYYVDPFEDGDFVKVLLVQPNLSNEMKHKIEHDKTLKIKSVDDQISVTFNALRNLGIKPDLVLWPETSYPETLDTDESQSLVYTMLRDFLVKEQVDILIGGYSKQGTNKDQNSLYLIPSDPQASKQSYIKQMLLPFAEYLPYSEYLGWLRPLLHGLPNYDTRSSITNFVYKNYRFKPFICYEDLYPGFGLDKDQMDIIVSTSNDGWLGNGAGSFQHFYYGSALAIEYRRPMLRVSNKGISGIISAQGFIIKQSKLDEVWTGFYNLRLDKKFPSTFYHKYGQYFIHFLFVVCGFILLFNFLRRKLY